MKAILFIGMIVLLAFNSPGQTTIGGRIVDRASGEAIENALITDGEALHVFSDSAGRFELVSIDLNKKTKLLINRAGYQDQILQLNAEEILQKTLLIELIPLNSSLPEVRISATPEIIWKDEILNVADFAFIGENLLLLAYTKEERWKAQSEQKNTLYKACQLVLCNENRMELLRYPITGSPIGFYENYPGELFLECTGSVFRIRIDSHELILEEEDKITFEEFIRPVIDSLHKQIYFSDFKPEYPAFDFMRYSIEDSAVYRIRHIEDKEDMAMFRAEYKYLSPRQKLEAFKIEIASGIDKEIVGAYISGYPNSIYYHPADARLFLSHDTIQIFDHQSDQIVRYSSAGFALDSSSISYHEQKRPYRWSGEITKDDVTGKIYTWTEKNGSTYLSEINTSTGDLIPCGKLTYQYASNIRVRNGNAYYIYRPFESFQNRFLYREKIRSEHY